MKTVLISGGTGIVGTRLSHKLRDKGYEVQILSRSKNSDSIFKTYIWDISKNYIDPKAVETADYIIHLAGAGIADKRWTDERKKIIIDSRVDSANLLFNAVKSNLNRVKAFISASGVGNYGAITTQHIFTESDPHHDDFLGKTCALWEASADQFETLGIRTVKVRTGVVLSQEGGALEKLKIPVQLGIGSALGSGKQYVPWIHLEDLCNIYIKAIEDAHMSGPYNAAAPEHLTNEQMTKSIAEVLHRPFFFPKVPSFAMNLLLGEMSELLLEGSRVSSEKIQKAGFQFKFPDIKSALKDLFRKN
ncbi:MAG TPA: TIGR01777 family oxidoreductase [Chitinophagales bacterium]|nr:TIGR01777 family oxidoreductase [Chitinophagales bacterium]